MTHLSCPVLLSTNLRLDLSLSFALVYQPNGPTHEYKEGIAHLKYTSFMHCNGLKEILDSSASSSQASFVQHVYGEASPNSGKGQRCGLPEVDSMQQNKSI